jgi:arsenite methyltransferase
VKNLAPIATQEERSEMNQLRKQTTSGLTVMSETLVTMAAKGATISTLGNEAQISILESTVSEKRKSEETSDSLFEHFAWLYILCREKLFRDDTTRMIQALWPTAKPAANTRLIEFGCGPGFYSSRLAERFPQISVLGIDSSESQLNWARAKARALNLANCTFVRWNVLALSCDDGTFDALIASRLFTVLPQRERAIAEMFRVLRSGGRCFVAEPRGPFRASIPLFMMWLLASVTRFKNGYREPSKATVLSGEAFERLFSTQPWRQIQIWQDGRYQYALCEKG